MIYEILDRELSFPGLDAPRMEDVMTQAGGSLTKAGCAKDIYVEAIIAREYVEAIIAREKEYPAAKFFAHVQRCSERMAGDKL